MPGSCRGPKWNGMEFNPRLGKWIKTLGRARLPEWCGRKRRNVDLVLSHMRWGSAELLTALGMKLNSSLLSSTSTSMSFGWHDSYSCVSADSFSTTAFLFFCETPLLTEPPLQKLSSPHRPRAPWGTTILLLRRIQLHLQRYGCLTPSSSSKPTLEVLQTLSSSASAFLLSTVSFLSSSLPSYSSFFHLGDLIFQRPRSPGETFSEFHPNLRSSIFAFAPMSP